MDDYYSLLGVDADASVDDIRAAYRERLTGLDASTSGDKAEKAALNKAWNVLSDPYQRGRYDEQRATATTNGEVVDDIQIDDASPVPAQPGQRQQRAPRQPRQLPPPTIIPPAGTAYPATRQRVMAMVIDIFVLLTLVTLSQIPAQALADSRQPEVVDRIEVLNDEIDALDETRQQANDDADAARERNDIAAADAKEREADDAEQRMEDLADERDDEAAKLTVYYISMMALAFFLGFLYLMIPSALTGRTFGKRMQKLKVLRADGSPLGWRGATYRYGLIMAVAFLLFLVLREIGAIVVLFGVTMWTRNNNRQGPQDRLARTIVVTDAPVEAGGS